MRKSFFAIGALVLMFSQSAFADWSTTRYFQCAATKRYTARAKLKPPGQTFYTWTYDGGCTYAETDISSLAVNGTSNCGYAWARADGNNWNQRSGWASCGWSWGDDVDLLEPRYSFAPMYSDGALSFENPENLTAATLNDNGIDFDESSRMITIKSMNGFLKVSSTDIRNNYSTFQIKVATFTGNGDATKIKQVLWYAKASILNGELYLEGNFSESDFKNNSNHYDQIFTISDLTKGIRVPNDIDIEEVFVEVSGDGGNLGIGISDNYAPNLDTEKGAQLIAKMGTGFNFSLVSSYDEITACLFEPGDIRIDEVMIVALTGAVTISRKISAGETSEIRMNTSGLTSGAYLFMLRAGSDFYSKKFILQ